MKFSNSEKMTRRTVWPHVKIPPNNWDIKEAHMWCRAQESDGKFYHHYTNTRWWFEKDEDAMMFALKWGGKT